MITLAVLGLMVVPSMASIVQVGSAGEAYADVTVVGATDLTLSSFAGGAGNYVVVAVASKTKQETGVINSVFYGLDSLGLIGSKQVLNTYWASAYLYGGFVTAATADLVMNYTGGNADSFDGVGFSVVSLSGVDSVGVVGAGTTLLQQSGGPLADSITTGTDGSIVLSSFMMGGPATAVTPAAGTTLLMDVNTAGGFLDTVMTSVDAATAGLYAPEIDWEGTTRRNAVISAEFVAIPEPATIGLFVLSALGALFVRRRMRV